LYFVKIDGSLGFYLNGLRGRKSSSAGEGMDGPLEMFKWWRFRGRVRALKAQRAGWEPPAAPVELRPLPVTMQAGRGSGKPH